MTQSPKKLNRFYNDVTVCEADGGYAVLLDGEKIKTPMGGAFVAPDKSLAEKIAAEWDAQQETLELRLMPLTQLLNTMIDHISRDRTRFVDGLMGYVAGDPVCFSVLEPPELVPNQKEQLGRITDWFLEEHGVEFIVTFGLSHVGQSEHTLNKFRSLIEGLTDRELTALQAAVAATGSVAISCAMIKGRINPEQAFEAAFLEELHQASEWGQDPEAEQKRVQVKKDLACIREFLPA